MDFFSEKVGRHSKFVNLFRSQNSQLNLNFEKVTNRLENGAAEVSKQKVKSEYEKTTPPKKV